MDKQSIISKLKNEGVIVTHFGDDLDNTASIEALKRETGVNLIVERVPAGQFREGRVNVDTGGHRGSWQKGDTIVIDGNPSKGITSTVMQLSLLRFQIPRPLIEVADVVVTGRETLDSRYGLNLARYLHPSKLFSFAEEGLLQKSLTDHELEKYSLMEAYTTQKEIITRAVEDVERFRIEDIVVSEKYIPMGAAVAYALGCRFYVSISLHKSGNGVTFAITSRPDVSLPVSLLRWGEQLSKEFSLDENTSFVYVDPEGHMIVAGGRKNPDFSIPWTIEETSRKIKKLFKLKEEEVML